MASLNRSGSVRDESDLQEVVRCVVTCVEQILRELPRGSPLRFDAAQEQIKKARQILEDLRSASASPSIRAVRASEFPTREGGVDSDARGI